MTVAWPLPGLIPTRRDRRSWLAGRVGASLLVELLDMNGGFSDGRRGCGSLQVSQRREDLGHGSRAPAVLGVEFGDVEHSRRLRGMRVVRPFIDAQVAELLAAERSTREHALDRLFDHALRELAFEVDLAERSLMPPI